MEGGSTVSHLTGLSLPSNSEDLVPRLVGSGLGKIQCLHGPWAAKGLRSAGGGGHWDCLMHVSERFQQNPVIYG